MEKRNIGIFVGRFNPPHMAHIQVAKKMIDDCGIDNCLLVIGSQNHTMTLRHFFSFSERLSFLKMVFPEVNIMGIPDFESDDEWIHALDHTVRVSLKLPEDESFQFTYYGGCEEDILFFINRNRNTKILNRFDGTTPKISATEIRDALISKRSLSGLVPSSIEQEVVDLFSKKWEVFKKI